MIPGCRPSSGIPVAIIVLAFLAGCGNPETTPAMPLPAIIDRSPFTGVPCSAPCWYGLVIGKSSEGEVRSTLEVLPFLDQSTIDYVQRKWMPGIAPNIDAQGVDVYASCIRPHQPCVELSVADNVLTRIDILLNYQISVGEIVENLGAPDYVGTQQSGVEVRTCEVVLIWYSKQLILTSAPIALYNSSPRNDCDVVQDTGKPASNLAMSNVSYRSLPWVDSWLHDDGSQYFRFTGTVPGK